MVSETTTTNADSRVGSKVTPVSCVRSSVTPVSCIRSSATPVSCIRHSITAMSFISFLLHVIVAMSLSATPVTSHECKLLTKYGKLTADCDNLGLTSIPRDLDHDIQILLFTNNGLTTLAIDEFAMYSALQEVSLVRNNIDTVAPDAFRGLSNLQKLDLEGNKITHIPPSLFQHLTSVRILNMNSNPLMVITKDALSHLKNIIELSFENCWLERIHPQAFRGLNKLYEMNLVNNELRILNADMHRYLPTSLKIMRLYRNPWNCDCKLRWLREYVESRNIQWFFYTNVPTCDKPELIHDIAWNNLQADKFACAAQIVTSHNVSTSIQLEVQGNVTINCVVQGDPKPDITWMSGSRYVSTDQITQHPCVSDEGVTQICSSLTFKDLTLDEEGDYRCIAQNSAGRSEITYKLWVLDPLAGGASTTVYGLTMETLIGIGIGALVLILLVIACIIWMVKRQNGTKRPSCKANNYKKQARNNHKNHSPNKPDKDRYQVEEDTAISDANNKDNGKHISVNCELPPVKLTKTPRESSPITENHLNAAKNNDFKMTIFKPEQKVDEKSHLDKTGTVTDNVDSMETTPLCDNKVNKTTVNAETTVTDNPIVPPDVVQRADDRAPSHRTPPIVVTPTNNHVQCTEHKRAKENPYAKPSDMKPTKQKKTDSKPETKTPQDEVQKDKRLSPNSSHHMKTKDDIHKPTSGGADKKKVTTFSIEPVSPSCKNPVCLKDHSAVVSPSSKSPTKSIDITDKVISPTEKVVPRTEKVVPRMDKLVPQTEKVVPRVKKVVPSQDKDTPPTLSAKQHIKGSKSMGGLSNSPERGNHIGVISPSGNKTLSAADRYKTLPNRPKITSQMDDSKPYGSYTRPRNVPSRDDYSIPSSKHSHYDIPRSNHDLPRPIKTAVMVSPRQLPPAMRGTQHEPQIHGFQPSLPPGPIPAHMRSKTLDPRSRIGTGSHGDRSTSSPTRKLPKAFEATSLDDLLSPPFGHITVQKPGTPRAQVHNMSKPGENDEYGTAV